MVALLLTVWVARADVVVPGPPCNATRCAEGQPVAYRSTYRDPAQRTTANARDELEALGFREVCSVGTGNYDHEVWCGPKGALPACVPAPKRADTVQPGPLRPPCPDGTPGTSCSDVAKCDSPAGYTATCRWIPQAASVPETLYCGPVPAQPPPVPSEEVTIPSGELTPRGRCDTAGTVASALAGVVVLCGATLRRRSRSS